MILGLFFLFILTFVEIYCTKKSVDQDKHKNLITSFLILSSLSTSLIIYLVSGFNSEDFKLFNDYRLYLCLAINSFSFYVIRKNFENNKDNITAINFGMFTSLLLLIPLSYFLSEPLGFSDAINLKYDSIYQMIFYFSLYTVIIVIYFFSSLINLKINNFKFLLLMILMASLSSFINVKMMQTYNGYLMYSCMSLSSLFLFLFLILKNKEYKEIKTLNKKETIKISLSWASLSPIYVFVNTLLPVEFLAIFKRNFSIINSFIFDKINNKKNNKFNKKDFILVFFMIVITFVYYLNTI